MKLKDLKYYDPLSPHTEYFFGDKVYINEEDETTGAFVGVKFSEETNDGIMKFIKDNDIPNPVSKDKLHCTVMYTYSDAPDLIDEERAPFDPEWIAIPKKFEIFNTQDNKNCLVLRIESDNLKKRHDAIIADYGVVYTHEEYKPHITLSYDCGDIDLSELDMKGLPEKITIVEEYASAIDPKWV